MVRKPVIHDKSQESGKVVVNITVDNKGRVTKAIPGARGSSTTSTILWRKAEQAAYQVQFDTNLEGPEEQTGSITFIFTLK